MKTNVLIIDDHVLFSQGLSLILKESGKFKVLNQVQDSREAVHNYCKLTPDLVLIDYNMPHLSGLDIVKALAKQVHKSKIVVLSMYAEESDLIKFKELGVNGYITKTTPADLLIASLHQVMDGEIVFEKGLQKKVVLKGKKDIFKLKNNLTNREIDILLEIKNGHTTQKIAENLSLSFYTVETHRKNINRKLNFSSKSDFFDFLKSI